MKQYLTLVLAVGLSAAAVQTSWAANLTKYQWSDDLCDNEAYYDPSQVSVKNIEDSFKIFERLTQVNLTDYSPNTPAQLRQLDHEAVDKLDNDYLQLNQQIKRLSILPLQSVFDMAFFKQKLQQDITNEYQLRRFKLMAYLDADNALTVAPKVCQEYLVPLTQSEEKLQAAWESHISDHIHKQEKLGNANYRTLTMNRYRSEKAKDAISYAKLDLVGYAWHNCLSQHNRAQGLTSEQVYEAKQDFERVVFRDTKKAECEMP